jgi:hypothetical protein
MPQRLAPARPRQAGMTPTATGEGEAVAQETHEKIEGRAAEYRVIFRAMRLPGLPADIVIGRVRVNQTVGPVWTQQTEIRQNPGWTPVYDKTMRRVPVGDGADLTACVVPVTLPEGDLSRPMEAWQREVLAAAAILVSIFDERIAQEILAEDVVVFDESGEAVGGIDQATSVREFEPTNRVLQSHREVLSELADLDLSHPDPAFAAARWYLRAAQAGPTPDAIVFLWVALEALSAPANRRERRKRTDVQWVESAVREAGLDPDKLDPSVGRLANLRADVVHRGIEQPDLLREGYYRLEILARLLIRHRLGVRAGWPLNPNASSLRPPFRQLAERTRRLRKTRWSS